MGCVAVLSGSQYAEVSENIAVCTITLDELIKRARKERQDESWLSSSECSETSGKFLSNYTVSYPRGLHSSLGRYSCKLRLLSVSVKIFFRKDYVMVTNTLLKACVKTG